MTCYDSPFRSCIAIFGSAEICSYNSYLSNPPAMEYVKGAFPCMFCILVLNDSGAMYARYERIASYYLPNMSDFGAAESAPKSGRCN